MGEMAAIRSNPGAGVKDPAVAGQRTRDPFNPVFEVDAAGIHFVSQMRRYIKFRGWTSRHRQEGVICSVSR